MGDGKTQAKVTKLDVTGCTVQSVRALVGGVQDAGVITELTIRQSELGRPGARCVA